MLQQRISQQCNGLKWHHPTSAISAVLPVQHSGDQMADLLLSHWSEVQGQELQQMSINEAFSEQARTWSGTCMSPFSSKSARRTTGPLFATKNDSFSRYSSTSFSMIHQLQRDQCTLQKSKMERSTSSKPLLSAEEQAKIRRKLKTEWMNEPTDQQLN